MTRDDCESTPLVEARRDGRLGPKESASLERHLASCAACARLDGELGELGELVRKRTGARHAATTSPLIHQRGRLRLLREAALVPSPRSRRGLAALGLAAVVALAVAVPVALAASRVHVGSVAAASERPALARRLPAIPSRVAHATIVRPDEAARFTRSLANGVDRVELRDGALSLFVRRQEPGERFLVATSDAEVEVRGTAFRVEAEGGRIQAVRVSEGKVEVRFRDAVALVGAGGEWLRPADEAAAIASATPAAPLRPAPVVRSAGSAALPREDAANGFVDGVRLIERGDYGAAVKKLQALDAAGSHDASSEDAAFLVVVALQRMGRREEAAAAARRYLQRYPDGYRRVQAATIAAGEERP